MEVYVLYNPAASWDYIVLSVYQNKVNAEIAKEEHPDCDDLEIVEKLLR